MQDLSTKNKVWLANNKVCFVTNSIGMPSSLFIASLKTYIDYIPIQNFWMIPGIRDNAPFYGLNAFVYMLDYMLQANRYDYVIYIDEDCFIADFNELIDEFKEFVNGEYCLAGSPDGGVMCHRNHSKMMINTFLSFWNIKLLREKNITYNKQYGNINKNQQILITGYDVYNTIGNLVFGDKYRLIKNKSEEYESPKSKLGISLFDKINPKKRNPKNYRKMTKEICK